jgi:hypothetical protein
LRADCAVVLRDGSRCVEGVWWCSGVVREMVLIGSWVRNLALGVGDGYGGLGFGGDIVG